MRIAWATWTGVDSSSDGAMAPVTTPALGQLAVAAGAEQGEEPLALAQVAGSRVHLRDRRAAERGDVGHQGLDLLLRVQRLRAQRLLARHGQRHPPGAQVEVGRQRPDAVQVGGPVRPARVLAVAGRAALEEERPARGRRVAGLARRGRRDQAAADHRREEDEEPPHRAASPALAMRSSRRIQLHETATAAMPRGSIAASMTPAAPVSPLAMSQTAVRSAAGIARNR